MSHVNRFHAYQTGFLKLNKIIEISLKTNSNISNGKWKFTFTVNQTHRYSYLNFDFHKALTKLHTINFV